MAAEQAKALHQEQRIEWLKQFEREKLAALETVFQSLEKEQIESLKTEFYTKVDTSPLFKKMLETKGFESATIQIQRKNFVAERYLPKSAHDFEEYLKNEGYDTKDGKFIAV